MIQRLAAIFLSFLLLVAAPAAHAAATYSKREIQIRTELVYYSSAREAALKRQYSASLYARDQKISTKQRELTAARKQLEPLRAERQQALTRVEALEQEIIDLKQQQNEELARKDQEFARMRTYLEAVAHDLMRSPDGQRAIEVYLAQGPGSAELAIDILQRATAKRTADDLRSIAYFGLDAKAQGRFPTPRVIALFEAVVAADPNEFFDWWELEGLYSDVGDEGGRRRAAAKAADTAQSDVEDAMAQNRLAAIDLDRGDYASAQRRYTEVLDIAAYVSGQTIDGRPRLPVPAGELLLARVGLMGIAMNNGDLAAAQATTTQILGEVTEEMKRSPDSLPARTSSALMMRAAGDFYAEHLMNDEAWNSYEQSIKIADALVDQYPDAPLFSSLLADGLVQAAQILSNEGDHKGAITRLDEAIFHYDLAARADPSTIDDPVKVAETLAFVAAVKGDAGDFAGAEKAMTDSLDVTDQLTRDFPNNRDVRATRGRIIGMRALIEQARGQNAKAIASGKEALAIFQNLASTYPLDRGLQFQTVRITAMLADMKAPGYSWSSVAAQLTRMGAQRALFPSEARLLEKARANAGAAPARAYR